LNLAKVVAVAAGPNHSVALKDDGTVWAWGYNYHGQLGDGTTTDRTTPVQVSSLAGVTAIATGGSVYGSHTLAMTSDGTVWAWGYNYYGQLGDGTTTNRTTPVQVSGLMDVTRIAAGGYHNLALMSDTTAYAWGHNAQGQLGDGTWTSRPTPVLVSGLTDVTRISAGEAHSLAIRADGTAWAWGYNIAGQLGVGSTTEHNTPAAIAGMTGAASVAAGGGHSLFLAERYCSSDSDTDGDVDLADFGGFQGCFNGPNRPVRDGCTANMDFDADNDVDLADFQQFQACFNGPNRPPRCL